MLYKKFPSKKVLVETQRLIAMGKQTQAQEMLDLEILVRQWTSQSSDIDIGGFYPFLLNRIHPTGGFTELTKTYCDSIPQPTQYVTGPLFSVSNLLSYSSGLRWTVMPWQVVFSQQIQR